MITRREFSKSVLATGAVLLGSDVAASSANRGLLPADPGSDGSAVKFPVSATRGFGITPVTPFKSDESLDGDLYQKIVDFCARKKANMFAAPMHIGEALSMSIEERKLVAKLAVEAADGRIPVFIHCSLSSTREVIGLAQHAQSVGAQGIVVVQPYFYHLGVPALIDHFIAVAKSIDIYMMVYHNLSVGELPIEVLPDVIRRCPNVIGMKSGSHEMGTFTETVRATNAVRPGFNVYDGVENIVTSVPVGGAGCFSPISELAPVLVKSLVDAALSGDYEKARPIQWKVTQLSRILAKFGGFAGLAAAKPARALMGRPCGIPRRPLPALDKETIARLDAELKNSGVLADEPRGWA
jgi:dihydrodipicolinate synthase/N-acetylneuraminate lyase